MLNDILHEIATTNPVTLLINGRKLPSGVLFITKREPSKSIMVVRHSKQDSWEYKVHIYDSNLNEVDCEVFDRLSKLGEAIDVDSLVYNTWMNELVLEKARYRLAHLVSAKVENETKDEQLAC